MWDIHHSYILTTMGEATTKPSLGIKGRWVLVADDSSSTIVTDQWVVIENGKITEISPTRPTGAADHIELDQALVLPGFINMHNHLSSAVLTRGLTEDIPADSYATELIYDILMPTSQLAVKHLSDTEIRATADLGVLEVIKGGTTTLVDMFRSGQVQNFDAAIDMGIRFYGAPYLFSEPDTDPIADWKRHYQSYHNREQERIKVYLGPHGVDTCDPDLLGEVKQTAEDYGCLMATHVAQSQQEVELLKRRHGRSPVAHLEALGLLGPNLLAAHCIYADDADLEILRATDTVVVNCPMTFARGGLFAPYQRFAGKGIRTVLGTDGYIMDVANEMRMAGLVSKLEFGRADVATAAELVNAMTLTAADVLGRPDLGRIRPGAKADVVVVDLKAAHFQPVADPLTAFVWYGSGADVSHVIIDGSLVVRDREFVLGDEDAIIEAGSAAVYKVWAAAKAEGLARYRNLPL